MDTIKKTAYLREIEKNNQCELTFLLKTEVQKVGLINQQVNALRSSTDTVESLLQHIVNKIKKLLQDKEGYNDDVKIPVALRRSLSKAPIQSKMVLQNLIKSEIRDIEFQIFDQKYFVVINAPLVKEIKLPLILYAESVVQPKLYCLFTEHSASQYTWYKSKDKTEWTEIAKTFRYKLTEADIGNYLKVVCVPCSSTLTGPSDAVISDNKVEPMGTLPTCPFEDRHKFTTQKLQENCFRMVSYNVLSNRYTESADAFPYCPPKVLAIDYRKQLIVKELLGYNADLICLQEVDTNIYINYYRDALKNAGYVSFYHKKGDKITEGLACFFNKSRFKKIDDHQIIYNSEIKEKLFGYLSNFLKSNPDLKECFMRQMTSLHVTVLKQRTSNGHHCIIVGNTHLFYHPDHELVRIVQINLATTYLNFLSKKYSQNGKVNVILSGDFNSVPTSGVFEYLTRGKISKNHKLFDNSKNKPELFHQFQFESACGIPKYTNYTDDFKNCLDYIFIEKNKMVVKNMVPLPTEEDLMKYTGLPNEVYPSDHLALVVDLEVIS